MKRFALLALLIFLIAIPISAQDLGATYTTDVGTSIAYPDSWSVELQDSLLILSRSDVSRAIIIDYPIVSQFLFDDPTLNAAVSAIGNEIFGEDYDDELVTAFSVLGRDAMRYDVDASANTVQGSIVAVRFSNERIGILIAININPRTLDGMIESFDNALPANDEAVVPRRGSTAPSSAPDIYFFQAGGRIIIPAGWATIPDTVNGNIEFIALQTADESVTGLAMDLSNVVRSDVPLDAVLDATGIDWLNDFGVGIGSGSFSISGIREVYRYNVIVEEQNGMMYIFRFDDGGTGLFIAYGDTSTYSRDINTLLGSFDNFGVLLRYVN